MFLKVLAFTLIFGMIFSAVPSNVNAYAVDHWIDVLYYVVERPLFITGAFLIIFLTLLGRFPLAFTVLKNTYMRAFGRVSFEAGLIAPITLTVFYMS
jgi:hypothetical protein